MRLEAILAVSLVLLASCSDGSYDECVKDAVANGKSEHGINVLVGLCDSQEAEKIARTEELCFSKLEKRYDAYRVSNYKNSLQSWEKCDASADFSQMPARVEDAMTAEIPAATEYPIASEYPTAPETPAATEYPVAE